jgi:hypothetical protein
LSMPARAGSRFRGNRCLMIDVFLPRYRRTRQGWLDDSQCALSINAHVIETDHWSRSGPSASDGPSCRQQAAFRRLFTGLHVQQKRQFPRQDPHPAMSIGLRPQAPSQSLLRFLRDLVRHDIPLPGHHGGMNGLRQFSTRRPRVALRAAALCSVSMLPCSQLRFSSPVRASACFATSVPRRDCTENGELNGPRRQKSWQERLWGMASRRAGVFKTEDIPESDEDSNFVFSRHRTLTAKAALEPRLRCTEVDEHGEPVITDGEYKKTELIAKVRDHFLLATKLRQLG